MSAQQNEWVGNELDPATPEPAWRQIGWANETPAFEETENLLGHRGTLLFELKPEVIATYLEPEEIDEPPVADFELPGMWEPSDFDSPDEVRGAEWKPAPVQFKEIEGFIPLRDRHPEIFGVRKPEMLIGQVFDLESTRPPLVLEGGTGPRAGVPGVDHPVIETDADELEDGNADEELGWGRDITDGDEDGNDADPHEPVGPSEHRDEPECWCGDDDAHHGKKGERDAD